MTVTLIGMPSSGKSTLGVLLAKALGLGFLDCDLVIQEKKGRLLHEIIKEEGEEAFLKIEEETVSSIDGKNSVIATGGSAVYGERAMSHLKRLGKIVYIKIPFEVLEERLGDYSHRGVVTRGKTLLEMYNERAPLYERWADITVEGRPSMSETVAELIRAAGESV